MGLFADPVGTDRHRSRFPELAEKGFFREWGGLVLSSIGIGTYLGGSDATTDAQYHRTIQQALALGCNVIDTAINYRCQRSERVIGEVLSELFGSGRLSRQEILVATKGGFLAYDGAPPEDPWDYIQREFIDSGLIPREELVSGCHCIAPGYLQNQIDTSLKNIGVSCIDVYYLHNPETQLEAVSREVFGERMRAAFEVLEGNVAAGKIRFYGTATWNGYRVTPDNPAYLSLPELVTWAREVGGDSHHFRVIQLPYNLQMTEAFTLRNQRLGDRELSVLEAAGELGLYVMVSASVMQRHLTADLPEPVREAFADLRTDAQRAIQFVRSTPGVGTALVGMKQFTHAEENLETAQHPPAPPQAIQKLIKKL